MSDLEKRISNLEAEVDNLKRRITQISQQATHNFEVMDERVKSLED